MIILGIDPGSRKTGYGVIETKGRKISYISSGVLNFSKQKDPIKRLSCISQEIAQLCEKFAPHEIAMESLIFVKSPTALIKLAQTRGAILGVLAQNYPDLIFEYSPNLVKSSATGHGHTDKEGVQKFMQMLLGLDSFKSDDESDALAVAICHALHRSSWHKGKPAISKKKGLSASLSHKVREL